MKKPKFNPIVTRVKLNPEQAVLACSCFDAGRSSTLSSRTRSTTICQANVSVDNYCNRNTRTSAIST